MKIVAVFVFFLFTIILIGANGDSFLYLPEHMLPSPGLTVKLPFNGEMATLKISGTYVVETFVDPNSGIVTGYRAWQSYDGDYKAIVYGFSFLNGTYIQADIDPNTHVCNEAFVTVLNCTGWSMVEASKYNNHCTYHRFDIGITANLSMTVHSAVTDSKRPVNMLLSSTVPGSTETSNVTYNFLSETSDTFPYVKCYF